MENVIILRYGEVFLKGGNRYYFESVLTENIKHALSDFKFRFVKMQNRYLIAEFNQEFENDIVEKLKKVFGLHSISRAKRCKTDLDEIAKISSDISPKEGTFRVTVNRADKKLSKSSIEIASDIGGFMLQHAPNLKVNLFTYDFEVKVDIRENGTSYVYFEDIACAGGLPVGTGGAGLLLLSGGIDSPVAGYMMAKRGMKIFAIHFQSMPYTSEMAKEKVISLAKILSDYTGAIEIAMVPFTEIQYAIHSNCPENFMITIMRRFMMRIAGKVAADKRCGAIITGESLGQVASQTVESITVTNAVSSKPVLRPVIGFDKSEIIDIANKIGTFKTSILPYEDCCTVFLPKNPVIKPILSIIEEAESVLNIDELVNNAVSDIEYVTTKE